MDEWIMVDLEETLMRRDQLRRAVLGDEYQPDEKLLEIQAMKNRKFEDFDFRDIDSKTQVDMNSYFDENMQIDQKKVARDRNLLIR